MSEARDTDQQTSDRASIRRAIKQFVQSRDEALRGQVITEIAVTEDWSDEDVSNELDALERNGLVYIVNEEVKIP